MFADNPKMYQTEGLLFGATILAAGWDFLVTELLSEGCLVANCRETNLATAAQLLHVAAGMSYTLVNHDTVRRKSSDVLHDLPPTNFAHVRKDLYE
jgi:predicted ABC-type sugar transport system permease subunit